MATTAASGGNRESLLGPRPAGCKRQRSRRWEPQPGQWHAVGVTERFGPEKVSLMVNFFKKHREVLAYLVFGVLTTLLNIVLYTLFSGLFGYEAANSWGNVLDNLLCILFAYLTNRAFVFASRTQGREALKEFGAFVTCRLGTLVLDAAIMMVFGNLLAAQGTALVEGFMNGLLSAAANWFGPDTVLHMATSSITPHASVSDGSAAIAVIGGADGPTAIFVTSFYDAQALWGLGVKVFSNVVVVVLNYVFSKLVVFKRK